MFSLVSSVDLNRGTRGPRDWLLTFRIFEVLGSNELHTSSLHLSEIMRTLSIMVNALSKFPAKTNINGHMIS